MGSAALSLRHYRFDLFQPLVIFGVLLITASAICSSLETAGSLPALGEDVQVVGGESSLGAGDFNPFAVDSDDCDADGIQDASKNKNSDLKRIGLNRRINCFLN